MNITITSVESMLIGVLIGMLFTSFAFIMHNAFNSRSQEETDRMEDLWREGAETQCTLEGLLTQIQEDNHIKLAVVCRLHERSRELTQEIDQSELIKEEKK